MEVNVECKYPEVITVVLDQVKIILVKTEYAWKPPRCKHCCVFGHGDGNYPKQEGRTPNKVWLKAKATNSNEKEQTKVVTTSESTMVEKATYASIVQAPPLIPARVELNGQTTTVLDSPILLTYCKQIKE